MAPFDLGSFAIPLFTKALDWAREEQLKRQASQPPRIDQVRMEESITNHIAFAKNWAEDFMLRDMAHSRQVTELYVPTKLVAGDTPDPLQPGNRYRLLLKPGAHRVVFGHPGAGKTTLVRRILMHLFYEEPSTQPFYECPLLVVLRDLPERLTLIDALLAALGLPYRLRDRKDKNAPEYWSTLPLTLLTSVLNEKRFLICCEGLDELSDKRQGIVRKDIQALSRSLTNSDLLVTARTQTHIGELSRAKKFAVQPFSDSDVQSFSNKWFRAKSKSTTFLTQLVRTPYKDASLRPLTLATLCMLFDKYATIPSPPKEIYHRLVNMYLEKWDEHRDIRRKSAYAEFGVDRKREFLCALAYRLSLAGRITHFGDDDLRKAFDTIAERFGLPHDDRAKVIREIESHTGLVVESGRGYQFYHRTLQDYLCADEIVRMPFTTQGAEHALTMPDALAVAVSLSSNPSTFLWYALSYCSAAATEKITSHKQTSGELLHVFWIPFVTRLGVEAVRFSNDAALGLAFLQMATVAWEANAQVAFAPSWHGMPGRFNLLLSSFAKAHPVKKVLKCLHGNCEVSKVAGRDLKVITEVDHRNRIFYLDSQFASLMY